MLLGEREPVHLPDLVEYLDVSTNYLSKFFKKAAGVGFSAFLARARVKIAKKSLADPVLPINEIAARRDSAPYHSSIAFFIDMQAVHRGHIAPRYYKRPPTKARFHLPKSA